ncbi:hypothetical protein Avbf_17465 [Armadillidium vulgare]|nr:hypothetical protein Avbf_17465 [Armadillidium vulgare]
MVGSHPSWRRTNASIPFNRTIGTEITWWCDGSLLYEGGEGGNRTKNGTLTCEEGPPSRLDPVCPKGFGLLDDGLRCFLFSNTSAISFIDASLNFIQCLKMDKKDFINFMY